MRVWTRGWCRQVLAHSSSIPAEPSMASIDIHTRLDHLTVTVTHIHVDAFCCSSIAFTWSWLAWDASEALSLSWRLAMLCLKHLFSASASSCTFCSTHTSYGIAHTEKTADMKDMQAWGRGRGKGTDRKWAYMLIDEEARQ